MSTALPFSLPSPFKPLSPSIAQSRLKINTFALALLVFFRSIFTPYRQFRRGVIWFADEYIQGRARGQMSWAKRGVWWIETVLTMVVLWNIAEAYLSVQAPVRAPQPASGSGLQLTPSRVSSPLTRAYPLTSKTTSSPSIQTPTRPQHLQTQHHPSSALARTASHSGNTPSRSSPLSASTAKALSIFFRQKESTGLFYPEDAAASPSKAGRGGQGQATNTTGGGGAMARNGSGEEFVMVEREEKEWVQNVWKGVVGKGGKVGL